MQEKLVLVRGNRKDEVRHCNYCGSTSHGGANWLVDPAGAEHGWCCTQCWWEKREHLCRCGATSSTYWYKDDHDDSYRKCNLCYKAERNAMPKADKDAAAEATRKARLERICNGCGADKPSKWYKDTRQVGSICNNCYNHRRQGKA
jgi:hypothetical protein